MIGRTRRARPRASLVVAAGVLCLVAAIAPFAVGSSGGRRPTGVAETGVAVVVLDRALPAGAAVDLAHLRRIRVQAAAAPTGAISEPSTAAYRIAVVSIPARLPLVPALLRAPRDAPVELRPGDRAVGIRVDDVSGVAALVHAGSIVDVVVTAVTGGSTLRVAAAEVLTPPRRGADGATWAVLLRVPVATAGALAEAQAAGRDVRLLLRGSA